jgi:hypothetical protein
MASPARPAPPAPQGRADPAVHSREGLIAGQPGRAGGVTIGRPAEELGPSRAGCSRTSARRRRCRSRCSISPASASSRRWRGWPSPRHGRAARPRLFESWLHWARTGTARRMRVVAASTEFDDQPGPVRDTLVRLQKDWLEFIAQAYRRAQAEGHFRSGDAEQFAQDVHGPCWPTTTRRACWRSQGGAACAGRIRGAVVAARGAAARVGRGARAPSGKPRCERVAGARRRHVADPSRSSQTKARTFALRGRPAGRRAAAGGRRWRPRRCAPSSARWAASRLAPPAAGAAAVPAAAPAGAARCPGRGGSGRGGRRTAHRGLALRQRSGGAADARLGRLQHAAGRLVPPLLQRGFSVVGLDAPAHGRTPGRPLRYPSSRAPWARCAWRDWCTRSSGTRWERRRRPGRLRRARRAPPGAGGQRGRPLRWARAFAAHFRIPAAAMDAWAAAASGACASAGRSCTWPAAARVRRARAVRARSPGPRDALDGGVRRAQHVADAQVVLTEGLGHRRILPTRRGGADRGVRAHGRDARHGRRSAGRHLRDARLRASRDGRGAVRRLPWTTTCSSGTRPAGRRRPRRAEPACRPACSRATWPSPVSFRGRGISFRDGRFDSELLERVQAGDEGHSCSSTSGTGGRSSASPTGCSARWRWRRTWSTNASW